MQEPFEYMPIIAFALGSLFGSLTALGALYVAARYIRNIEDVVKRSYEPLKEPQFVDGEDKAKRVIAENFPDVVVEDDPEDWRKV